MQVVIYKSDTCGACRAIVPRLLALAKERGLKVKVVDAERCEADDKICKDLRYVPAIFVDGREIEIKQFIKILGEG